MENKKIIICISLFLCMTFMFVACKEKPKSMAKEEIKMNLNSNVIKSSTGLKTDKKPISNRFPKLGQFEKCFWIADTVFDSGRNNVPGPTSYWMKGYVFLSKQDFETFKSNYKWESVDITCTPEIDKDILEVTKASWVFSEEFNNFIKPPSFFGKFCLDIENGIVYFDVFV